MTVPELTVGRIETIVDHSNADKLFIEQINTGSDELQVISGLKPHYDKEELEGKNVVIVTNLEPAKLRGERSEAMLLAVDAEDQVSVVIAPDHEPGDHISFDQQSPEPRISFDDFMSNKLSFKQGFLYLNEEKMSNTQALRSMRGVDGPVR